MQFRAAAIYWYGWLSLTYSSRRTQTFARGPLPVREEQMFDFISDVHGVQNQ